MKGKETALWWGLSLFFLGDLALRVYLLGYYAYYTFFTPQLLLSIFYLLMTIGLDALVFRYRKERVILGLLAYYGIGLVFYYGALLMEISEFRFFDWLAIPLLGIYQELPLSGLYLLLGRDEEGLALFSGCVITGQVLYFSNLSEKIMLRKKRVWRRILVVGLILSAVFYIGRRLYY